MRILCVILVIFICTNSSSSQEAAGLYSGNHSGLNATKINPSFMFKSDNKWDLQLIGAHHFSETNYAFIHRSSLWDLGGRYNEVQIPEQNGDIPIADMSLPVIFKSDAQRSFFDIKNEVRGLGIMVSIAADTKVGISTNARSHASSFDIPSALNYHEVSQLRPDTSYILQKFDANAAAWTEFNGHIAVRNKDHHSFGATIKYLRAYAGASLINKSDFSYTNPQDNIVNSSLDGEIQFAMSGDDGEIRTRGTGWAVDLGYMSSELDTKKTQFGLSLIDLGYIKYNDPSYLIELDNTININMDNYQNISSTEELITQLSSDFTTLDSTDSYTLLLPTALSAQFKRSINNHLTLEMSMVKNIHYSDRQIQRSDMINATFVYDRKHFSAFIPVTAYDYKEFRVGAAVRFLYFTIGSDHLASLFGRSQSFQGADLYANIQLYPFSDPDKYGGKKIKCYY